MTSVSKFLRRTSYLVTFYKEDCSWRQCQKFWGICHICLVWPRGEKLAPKCWFQLQRKIAQSQGYLNEFNDHINECSNANNNPTVERVFLNKYSVLCLCWLWLNKFLYADRPRARLTGWHRPGLHRTIENKSSALHSDRRWLIKCFYSNWSWQGWLADI